MTGRPQALWVKICGLRTAPAIAAAAAAGAQAVGFVFHEASPRNLTIGEAQALQGEVPAGVERVAVFLHPAQALLDGVIAALRPDWVQLDAADLANLRLPAHQRVLPVLRGGAARRPLPARFLFESAHSGSGEKADWSEASTLAAAAEVVLAGGLDAANVAEAIASVRPFGIDVSSGVESSRGVKDPLRIRDFVAAARAAQARLAGCAIERSIEEKSR
jgi:phosphoribosylanthranilate isomerase